MQFPHTPFKFENQIVGIATFSDFIETSPNRITCDFSEAVPATTHGCRNQALTRGMGVSVSSRHSTATTATSSEPPWKKYRPSRAPHRLTHVLSERNIAPARSKWAKYCTFRRAGAKNISRHPTTPHAGAVFLSPQLHPDPQAGHNSPCSALSAHTRETVRPASSISAAVCEKVRPASPNGRKTLFSGVLGEFFRGDVAGGAVSGEFFRAVGLAAGPIYWHPR